MLMVIFKCSFKSILVKRTLVYSTTLVELMVYVYYLIVSRQTWLIILWDFFQNFSSYFKSFSGYSSKLMLNDMKFY